MNRASAEQSRLCILVDGHTFDAGPQGTTTFLAGILNAMPEAAKELGTESPQIICAAKDRANVEKFLNTPFEYASINGGFLRRNLIEMPRLGRRLRPDITLSQYVRPAFVHGQSVAVIHDVLFLDFPHLFSWTYRNARRVLFGWSARTSDIVVTVSEYSRSRIAHWFRRNPESIAVLPNGVDASVFKSVGKYNPAGPIRMVYVSRLERRKRQYWCVAAVETLTRRGIDVELDLVGAGDGDYADEVKAKIAAAVKVGVPVRHHEGISEAELLNLMQHVNIALFPSTCEGFGIPVIEASACGLPCVVADNTALTELRPYFSGPLFEPGKLGSFVKAIGDAVAELPRLHEDAQRIAKTTHEVFSWKNIAKQFLTLLHEKQVR